MWWCLHDGIKNRGSTHKSGVSETQSWADGPELRPLNHIGDRPKGDRREFAVSSAKRDYLCSLLSAAYPPLRAVTSHKTWSRLIMVD
jgi:hypothetical protein